MYRLNEPFEIWIGSPTQLMSLVIDDPVIPEDGDVSVMLFDHATRQSWCAETEKSGSKVFAFRFTEEQTADMAPDSSLTLEIYLQRNAGDGQAAGELPYVRITNYAHAVNCSQTQI